MFTSLANCSVVGLKDEARQLTIAKMIVFLQNGTGFVSISDVFTYSFPDNIAAAYIRYFHSPLKKKVRHFYIVVENVELLSDLSLMVRKNNESIFSPVHGGESKYVSGKEA